jgi:hypothetical protein
MGGFDIVAAKFKDIVCTWQKSIGDTLGQFNQFGHAIAFASDGTTLVGGTFNGTVKFEQSLISLNSNGFNAGFVAKLEGTNGSLPWSKQLSNSSHGDVHALAVDTSDNIIVAGHFQKSMSLGCVMPLSSEGGLFVAKLNSNGMCQWQKQIGVGTTAIQPPPMSIRVAPNGDIVVAGTIPSMTTLFPVNVDATCLIVNATPFDDAFVAKINPADGTCKWSKQLGDVAGQVPSDQRVHDIAVDKSGNVYATGEFFKSISFGDNYDITNVNDKVDNKNDGFVVKLQSGNGAWEWSQGITSTATAVGNAIALDEAKSFVIVAGTFDGTIQLGTTSLTSAGSTDVFLAKLTL